MESLARRARRTVSAVVAATAMTLAPTIAAHAASPDPLSAWGLNTVGQVGDNTLITRNKPTHIGTSTSTWRNVAAGRFYSVAIDSLSHVWAWGLNSAGQLGVGNTMNQKVPAKIVGTGGSIFTSVAAGGSHTLAIDSTGHLWAWGSNVYGQLGAAANSMPNPATMIASVALNQFIAVAAGADYTVAITTTGQLWAWGRNNTGQLGFTTNTTPNPTPTQIPGTWASVAAGVGHTVAIDNSQRLWAWGSNGSGQFGNTTTTPSATPVQIGIKLWKSVAAGRDFTVAIDSNSHLFAWGLNDYYQLGDNTTTNRLVPTAPSGTAGITWTSVAAGGAHTLAIGNAGHLFAWGSNGVGQLGNGGIVSHIPAADCGKVWTAIAAEGVDGHSIGLSHPRTQNDC